MGGCEHRLWQCDCFAHTHSALIDAWLASWPSPHAANMHKCTTQIKIICMRTFRTLHYGDGVKASAGNSFESQNIRNNLESSEDDDANDVIATPPPPPPSNVEASCGQSNFLLLSFSTLQSHTSSVASRVTVHKTRYTALK